MNIELLINDIREAGLELWLDNGNLKLRGPQSALSPELVGQLRTFKPLVIDWLKENGDTGQPLTSAQGSLWTLYQLDPEAPDYNVACAIALQSEVDIAALDRAYQRLIERHPSLQVAFTNGPDGPCQKPAKGRTLRLEVKDVAESSLEAEVNRAIDQPFRLETGHTSRLSIIRVEGRNKLLVLALHHIVADFLSMDILLDELAALYLAASKGSEAKLQKTTRSLSDFLAAERTYFAGERAERDWLFWERSLQGSLPILDLQPFRPERDTTGLRGHTHRVRWTSELSDRIKSAAAQHGVTAYNFLLAIYYVLLAKGSSQDDLIVGMRSTDRSETGAGNAIGHFINSLPVRIQFDGATPFAAWLKHVQHHLLEAIEHREFPFPLMVQRLSPERKADHSPIFQFVFNWNQARRNIQADAEPRGAEVFGDVVLATSNGITGANSDLDLTIADRGTHFDCSWNFSERLYPKPFMAALAQSFEALVAQAAANPDLRLDAFSLCSTDADPASFRLMPKTPDGPPPRYSMFRRFLEQAADRPNAIAIKHRDTTVTYGELEAWSGRIARHLRNLGLGPEDCIGLSLSRTPLTIAAILGVLRSGGAYLPLDPTYPAARLRQVVDSAHPKLILVDSAQHQDTFADASCVQLASLLDQEPAQSDSCAIDPALTPDHFAYLIYTSGSTGVPKGAALTHGNAAALIEWALSEFSPEQRACILGSTSISFDLSIMEIFCALSGGTTLLLVDNILERLPPPDHQAITMVVSIPTLIESVAKQGALPPNTRSIVLAGEATSRRVADLLHRYLPDVDVHNLYGPTEDTTYDAGKIVSKGTTERPSIGAPQPYRYAYVLDAGMNPVPPDVCGEIYLGGAGLARGYYGRPDLTAERFLPDPFAKEPGARVYRSGDIGMVSPDGELHCYGRLDRQVKVRGFRIELQEVEIAMDAIPAVQDVYVTTSAGPDSSLRIVAYVVTDKSHQDVAYFEQELSARLPQHMLPSRYVWLAELPRLPNGKLDRRALPDPEQVAQTGISLTSADASDADSVSAVSPVEQLVAGVWSDLLDVDSISRSSHFFRLGGHSLLAAQVVARINRALNLTIPGGAVLETPILGDFIRRVEQATRGAAAADSASRSRLARVDGTPDNLSNAQRRLWLLDRLATTDRYVYNIPLTLELRGPLDVERLSKSLNNVFAKHEVLRTRIVEKAGSPRAEVMAPVDICLRVNADSADWQTEALRLVRQPFDLTKGPLYACHAFKTGDHTHVLLLIIHHIVFDGYSTGILVEDLLEAYRSGQNQSLSATGIRYADYAAWQARSNSESQFDAQLNYWEQALGDAPTLLRLPEDLPRPVVMSHRGDAITVAFPDHLARSLQKLARQNDSTLFMLLYAAFSVLVSRYATQRDLIIGTPYNNRNHVQLEDVVGMFVNTLAVRTQVSPATRFADHLASVRRNLLDAYAHADVPFERVVEVLQPERASSHHPLVQVTFALEHLDATQFATDGLEWNLIELPEHAAKFDLSVQMRECSGQLSVKFTYNADLYHRESIAAMARHWVQLCEAIVEQPRAQIRQLSMLTQQEQRWLIDDLNASSNAAGSAANLIATIRTLAHLQPEATAISDGKRHCTYADLVAEAARVATGLKALGVGSEHCVGVCMPMSAEAIIAMLGIMMAGACYVPIDPATPAQRVATICSDAQVRAVLVDTVSTLSLPTSTPLLDVASLRQHTHAAPLSEPFPQQLAYVIFTSGSTGQPKGVAVSHAALQNLITWHVDHYGIQAGTRTTQTAGFGFDAAVWEIWPTLFVGGTLLVADADTRIDPQRLVEWLRQERADLCFLPTPLAEALLRLEASHTLPLRALLTGGDRLTMSAPETASFKLVNHYGPTENAVVATAHTVTVEPNTPPIGLPITGVRAYVLDESLNPVPTGITGELYLAGASLARGYVALPVGTAERFVPDPFNQLGGSRMYRTGDLVCRDPQGVLHFRGRADGQVKLRGYRIELDEIRIGLEQSAEVAAAVVQLHTNSSDVRQIAAWIVPAIGANAEGLPKRLRAALASTLPDYMLPTAMAVLEALPLTVNGKVDRRALPEPTAIDGTERHTVSARTPQEELLVGLWESLIGHAPIGVTDNFFDVGGHSLLAMQIATKIQEATGRECTVRTLLDHPTIAELAVVLSRADQSRDESLPILVSKPEQRYEPFPLTPIQQTYLVGRQGIYDLGDIATQAYSEIDVHDIDPARTNHAWRKLIRRHEMLRMVLTADLQQRILADVPDYHVVVEDLSRQSEEDAAQRLLAIRHEMSTSARTGQQWPLFENRLTRLPNGRWRMHTTIDALIADGWSTKILMTEFLDSYFGQDDHHEPLTLSYRDYVLAEQKIQQTDAFTRSKAYWIQRIPDLPPPPELPLKTGRQDTATGRFRRRTATLPAKPWQQFQKVARALGLTPTNLLLAAYARTLSSWSTNPRFTLNLTLFNRLPLHPQVNALVGDFTSLTLLEVDASSPEFAHFAQRLQQQLWSDLDHKYFSGVDVLRELARNRGNGKQAVMPVVFTSSLTQSASGSAGNRLEDRLKDFVAGNEYGSSQTSQVWIDHVVAETDGELVLTWESVDELFEPGVLDAMFAFYSNAVARIAAHDFAGLHRNANVLPQAEQERRRLVNATEAPVSAQLLHQLVRNQAAQTPERIAVIAPDRTLTYQQVWATATTLAAQLREAGVKPNQLVAVLMHKGWQQVVACLAIQQAGAAYLPIDANLPSARREQILTSGEVTIVLTQPEVMHEREPDDGRHWQAIDDHTVHNATLIELDDVQGPEDLAYVIFTSGSTGVPKGVMIDHRGAVNTVLDINRRWHVGPNDRVLALSALSFDLSVYDIFGLLAVGGALVLPAADEGRDPDAWSRLIAAHNVTIFNAVPALMQLLLETDQNRQLPIAMRLVLMSGDWIPVDLPARIRRAALNTGIELIALGGATEASIWSNYHQIIAVDPSWKSIPYGRPLTNQWFHVLDRELQHCPDWVAGDLYIGGVGLAKGYWRDTAKTAESFIRHPSTGERLYRTGDLGRYRHDGEIEFLGRRDSQVKIQGFRVELGEIESLLDRHEAVSRSTASVFSLGQSGNSIVAYVVPAGDSDTVAPKPGLIQDDTERMAFTLSARSIRNDLMRAPRILLRQPDAVFIATQPLDFPAQQDGETAALGYLLGALVRQPVAGSALGKHYYPSAGSLYPVQVYVAWGDSQPGMPAGLYYHHPLEHALCRVGDVPSGLPLTISLVAEHAAIAPMYGDSATPFCELEAGYIQQLLEDHGQAFSWQCDPIQRDARSPEWLPLTTSQRCVLAAEWRHQPNTPRAPLQHAKALGLFTRQSYRAFNGEAANLEQLPELLQRGGNTTSLLVFEKHATGGRLSRFGAHGLVDTISIDAGSVPVYEGLNRNIANSSSFAIFITHAGTADTTQHVAAGRQAQTLMAQAPELGLGLCPIGSVDVRAMFAAAGIAEDVQVVHALLGGSIAPDQTQQWTAYQSGKSTETLPQQLRQYLAERLPAYMVPAHIMLLDAIPLSSNGKVDRKALPQPDLSRTRERDRALPSTELERTIAALWCDVLGVSEIGIHDNFFEVGGNSILLIQVHRRLQEAMKISLPIVSLFRHSDIASLTEHLKSQGQSSVTSKQQELDDARSLAQRQRAALARGRDRSPTRATPQAE